MDELPTDTIIYIYGLIGKPLIFDIMRYVIEYAIDHQVNKNNGIVVSTYNKFGGKLFGLQLIYNNSSNIRLSSRAYYLNCKRHGLTQRWHSLDRYLLTHEENYLHGKQHGKQVEYHSSGKIKSIEHWNNGKLHGGSITYDDNNKIISNIIYDDDKIISIFVRNLDGSPRIDTVVIGEKSIITKYTKGSIQFTTEIMKGKRHGETKVYNNKRQQIFTCSHFNGFLHGKVFMWNASNKLEYEAEYVHGKLEGPITKWDAEGNIIMSAFAVNGKLQGKYMEKDKNEICTCEFVDDLINGKLVVTKGKIDILIADMKDGLINGILEGRHDNGKLMAKAEYVRSMLHGKFEIYDEDDKVMYHGTYNNNIHVSGNISKNNYEELDKLEDMQRPICITGPLNVNEWINRYVYLGNSRRNIGHYEADEKDSGSVYESQDESQDESEDEDESDD